MLLRDGAGDVGVDARLDGLGGRGDRRGADGADRVRDRRRERIAVDLEHDGASRRRVVLSRGRLGAPGDAAVEPVLDGEPERPPEGHRLDARFLLLARRHGVREEVAAGADFGDAVRSERGRPQQRADERVAVGGHLHREAPVPAARAGLERADRRQRRGARRADQHRRRRRRAHEIPGVDAVAQRAAQAVDGVNDGGEGHRAQPVGEVQRARHAERRQVVAHRVAADGERRGVDVLFQQMPERRRLAERTVAPGHGAADGHRFDDGAADDELQVRRRAEEPRAAAVGEAERHRGGIDAAQPGEGSGRRPTRADGAAEALAEGERDERAVQQALDPAGDGLRVIAGGEIVVGPRGRVRPTAGPGPGRDARREPVDRQHDVRPRAGRVAAEQLRGEEEHAERRAAVRRAEGAAVAQDVGVEAERAEKQHVGGGLGAAKGREEGAQRDDRIPSRRDERAKRLARRVERLRLDAIREHVQRERRAGDERRLQRMQPGGAGLDAEEHAAARLQRGQRRVDLALARRAATRGAAQGRQPVTPPWRRCA